MKELNVFVRSLLAVKSDELMERLRQDWKEEPARGLPLPDAFLNAPLPPEIADNPTPWIDAIRVIMTEAAVKGAVSGGEILAEFAINESRDEIKKLLAENRRLKKELFFIRADMGRMFDWDDDSMPWGRSEN